MLNLKNKTVLVTGASSGLGAHFSKVLLEAGANVVLGARRTEKIKQMLSAYDHAPSRVLVVELDVTRRESVNHALENLVTHFGQVDVVVNNAGVSDTKSVLDFCDRDWDNIVDTNLKGAWIIAQESARRMINQGVFGSIINVTSILANRTAGGVGPYCAAKAGLAHLTRSMALELAKHQIRVNSLAPGYVITEINKDFLESESGDKLRKRIPMRKFCHYDDLNGALMLLATDASRAMTGSEIVVDNGHSCSGL